MTPSIDKKTSKDQALVVHLTSSREVMLQKVGKGKHEEDKTDSRSLWLFIFHQYQA